MRRRGPKAMQEASRTQCAVEQTLKFFRAMPFISPEDKRNSTFCQRMDTMRLLNQFTIGARLLGKVCTTVASGRSARRTERSDRDITMS